MQTPEFAKRLPEFLTEVPFGDVRLTGHRISLYLVAKMHLDGKSVDEIVEEYPTLAPEHVRKVNGFIDANRSAVVEYVAEWEREADRIAAEYSGKDLREKLRKRWAELYPGRPLPGTTAE